MLSQPMHGRQPPSSSRLRFRRCPSSSRLGERGDAPQNPRRLSRDDGSRPSCKLEKRHRGNQNLLALPCLADVVPLTPSEEHASSSEARSMCSTAMPHESHECPSPALTPARMIDMTLENEREKITGQGLPPAEDKHRQEFRPSAILPETAWRHSPLPERHAPTLE